MADVLREMNALQKEMEQIREQRAAEKVALAKVSGFKTFGERYFRDPVGFAQDCLLWEEGEGLKPYQEKVLRTLHEDRRVCLRSCRGAGKCVAATELIPLADGRMVEAAELVGRCFGVVAFEPDGSQTHRLAWASDNGIELVYQVTTTSGRTIVRTGNHPLRVADYKTGRKPGAHNPRWQEVETLKAGDLVLIPDAINVNGKKQVEEDHVKLVGYLLGDGTTGKNQVLFHQQDGPAKDEFVRIVKDLGCDITPRKKRGELTFAVVGKNRKQMAEGTNPVLCLLREWGMLGHNFKRKRFPDWAWELPNDQLALLLNRLFACDGYAYVNRYTRENGTLQENARVGITLANEGLIRDVEMAMLRLGVNGRIRHRTMHYQNSGFHDRKSFDAWEWEVQRASEILKVVDRVGIFGKESAIENVVKVANRLKGINEFKWNRRNAPSGYRWERVVSIEPKGEVPTVAITVPGPETFVTTMVEHNTTSSATAILHFMLTREAMGIDWKVLITASVSYQLSRYMMPEISRLSRLVRWDRVGRGPFSNKTEFFIDSIRLKHGLAFCVTPGPESAAKAEGAHARQLLLAIDEGKSVPNAIYDACEGSLGAAPESGRETYALATSTPGAPYGRFYDIQVQKPGLTDWTPIHVTIEDVIAAGMRSRDWVEARKQQWGETSPLFITHVLGDFAEEQSDSLIPVAWIEAAFDRWEAGA